MPPVLCQSSELSDRRLMISILCLQVLLILIVFTVYGFPWLRTYSVTVPRICSSRQSNSKVEGFSLPEPTTLSRSSSSSTTNAAHLSKDGSSLVSPTETYSRKTQLQSSITGHETTISSARRISYVPSCIANPPQPPPPAYETDFLSPCSPMSTAGFTGLNRSSVYEPHSPTTSEFSCATDFLSFSVAGEPTLE